MDEAAARTERARHLMAAGRFDLAEREYREVLRFYPESAACHAAIAWCLIHLGRPNEADPHVQSALGTQPDKASHHLLHASLLLAQNRGREALTAIASALRLDPDDAAAHAEQARINLHLGRWQSSLDACEQSLSLAPDQADLHGMRALALTNLGRNAEAGIAATAALTQEPNALIPHVASGWTHLQAGRKQEAEAAFREALRLSPSDLSAQAGLLTTLRNRASLILRLPRQVHQPLIWAYVLGLPACLVGENLSPESFAHPIARWTAIPVLALLLVPITSLPLGDAWIGRNAIGRNLLKPYQWKTGLLIAATLTLAAALAGWGMATGTSLAPACIVAFLVIPFSSISHPTYDSDSLGTRVISAFLALSAALVLASHAGLLPWPTEILTRAQLWATIAWMYAAPSALASRNHRSTKTGYLKRG